MYGGTRTSGAEPFGSAPGARSQLMSTRIEVRPWPALPLRPDGGRAVRPLDTLADSRRAVGPPPGAPAHSRTDRDVPRGHVVVEARSDVLARSLRARRLHATGRRCVRHCATATRWPDRRSG